MMRLMIYCGLLLWNWFAARRFSALDFFLLFFFSLSASHLLLKMNISADFYFRSSETPLLQSCQWDLLKKKKSALFLWIQDERCQNLSHALNPTSPSLHDRSTHQILWVQLSLWIPSYVSPLSLSPSLQSIYHLKCPGIFLQMSINRQIDFISSAVLLQSWWMNLTFLSSPWWYCLICFFVFLSYFLGACGNV